MFYDKKLVDYLERNWLIDKDWNKIKFKFKEWKDKDWNKVWSILNIEDVDKIRKIEILHKWIDCLKWIEVFKNLEILNLGWNNLKEIPSNIWKLVRLKKLYVWHNKIESVSDEISKLNNLELLDIGYNELSTIPKWIEKLSRLSVLVLEHNKIDKIDINLKWMKDIEIYLWNNKIQLLPKNILDLDWKVKKLYLKWNINLWNLNNDFCYDDKFVYSDKVLDYDNDWKIDSVVNIKGDWKYLRIYK